MAQDFKIVSAHRPTGDQPQAISQLVSGLEKGEQDQLLLGVTGSGKTFTMANIIEKVQKPTLVMAHNKTLAAQLASEFRELFPENAVDYFVSYYDYYQPEAYIARSDTFIEKETTINDEIEKYRHLATYDLLTRRDVIVVASVSAIYGLGSPEEYIERAVNIEKGQKIARNDFLRQLLAIQYQRNDVDFKRGSFRVRGDVVEVWPAGWDSAVRVEFWGDEMEALQETDHLTGEILNELEKAMFMPAKHAITSEEKIEMMVPQIQEEMEGRVAELRANGREVEAQRLQQRTLYDMDMLRETGYVNGIENYTRYLSGLQPGEPPYTLLDYFPKKDWLLLIDESHMTVPQIGAMYEGNLSRKRQLVEYGFRLPSAYDNRPLRWEEFEKKMPPTVYVSATPGKYELKKVGVPGGDLFGWLASERGEGEVKKPRVLMLHGKQSCKKPNHKTVHQDIWRGWLKKELEKKDFEVSNPLIEKNWEASYEDWRKIIEKNDIDENTIVIGESAGGAAIVRYLGETDKKIKALIGVAAAKYSGKKDSELAKFYDFEIKPEIRQQISVQPVFFVSNDEERHVKAAYEYSKALGGKLIELPDRGHFYKGEINETFPELLEEIMKTESATQKSDTAPAVVQQVIRPTGLLDPQIDVRPIKGQIDDLLEEIRIRLKKNERVLITTLTKKMSEELTDFLKENGLKVSYLHSEVDTLDRIKILRDLRLGEIDIIVGINLLREGLDLPEVSLVAILDADKQGFLRSRDALLQTIGRTARHAEGRVIMYADKITDAMRQAIDETERRRVIQEAYNEEHGITPQTIIKKIGDLEFAKDEKAKSEKESRMESFTKLDADKKQKLIEELEGQMDIAVKNMEFEKAAELRDEIEALLS